jgi:hypothetical protein
VPPHEPRGKPAGRIYQAAAGAQGHVIGAEHATDAVRAQIERRLPRDGAVALNKNPYNTVRVPWLRALFPEALIVAMIRQPVPNVYSLVKKHVPHEGRGLPPHDGWWGVKPARWRELVSDDKVVQSARQWRAVNTMLAGDRELVDAVVAYDDLCASPRPILELIGGRLGLDVPTDVPTLRSTDEEHRAGSRLLSKNREFRSTGRFDLPDAEPIELPPFDEAQVAVVRSECDAVARSFPELA